MNESEEKPLVEPLANGASEEESIRKKQKLVDALSNCGSILDFPPEVICKLFSIKPDDAWKLSQIIDAAKNVEVSVDNVSEILDLARVSRIMEEDGPKNLGYGPMGATGPTPGVIGTGGRTGCGITGFTGSQGSIDLGIPKTTDPAVLSKFAGLKKNLGLLGNPPITKK